MGDVTIPIGISTKNVTEQLKGKIADGTYRIGSLIISQRFEETVLKNGKIYKKEVHVSGKKIDLESICIDMYNQHKKIMRLRSDNDYSKLSREDTIKQLRRINEFDITDIDKNTDILKNKLKKFERTCNLIFWHDGSTISNHSHILVMVSCLYDPAIFLTDEEYSKSNGVLANLQAIVEKPFLYILARSPSTDQQLLYSNERLADILKIEKPIQTPDGIPIYDTVRTFKGKELCLQLLLDKFSLHKEYISFI